MKKYIFISVLAVSLTLGSCGNRKVKRIDPSTQTDLSGRWNDTDSRLVAEEMIKDVLERPWRTQFVAQYDRRPVVIVGSVRNRSTEQIEASTFIKNIERAFINSGTVSVVQSGEDRKELRDERSEQQIFASEESRKRWGKEKGADFMLNGVINSLLDQYKNRRTITYQVNLELTNLETNEKVWLGEKEIKKFIRN
jgi:uncharacterized protein (TIGR02722 family)